jgi:hypothetical protein
MVAGGAFRDVRDRYR